MRPATIGILILGAIGAGSAFAQTSAPNSNPPMVNEPAKPAVPEDRRAEATMPRNGVITPAPGASSDTGTTVHPPNVDPGIYVTPRSSVGGGTTVTPK